MNIHHAIQAHSYSANKEARTIETKLLSDSDKIDAIGYMGISRLFYTAGSMGSHISSHDGPFATPRELDEKKSAADQFFIKINESDKRIYTLEASAEARNRLEFMRQFIEKMVLETNAAL